MTPALRPVYRIGWFSTGRDKAARELLAAVVGEQASGRLKAQISFVFSHCEPGESRESDHFFRQVRGYGIPLVCLSSRLSLGRQRPTAEWRRAFDQQVMERLADFSLDLGVLAGYMLIVGEEMCHRYPLINLHPAAPGGPTGTWQEVVWQLIEERAGESGVMMHRATPELDRGPVATFCTYPLRGGDLDRAWQAIAGRSVAELKAQEGERLPLFQLIRREGVRRELPLIVATLRAFSRGTLRFQDDQVMDARGKPIPGLDLTAEIEAGLKKERG
ncbi:MAG: phosphoglycerate transporter [Chloroflexi bacterium]|nr:phosphoglycerate transporter [Chloroflexota bacterium]